MLPLCLLKKILIQVPAYKKKLIIYIKKQKNTFYNKKNALYSIMEVEIQKFFNFI